ncbi:adhesive plaque matrix protein-like isoform X2 [Scylla paramamosain]|uniref:adhesive plaque matrix protein-like isoform X2 n=1 Tax=Scylla paramamosain TaxID=85552 RepID=UPI003082C5E2
MGAKTAVLDGLKEARESLVTGLKSAVTAKTEAFSSLTKGSQLKHKEQRVPVGAVVPYPIYPPYPKPQQTYPQPSYPHHVYHKASYPPHVYQKPVYQHKPAYPLVVYPAYHQYQAKPNPLEALKAKVEGYVEAKKAAVSGALAKVEEAKATLNAKIKALFKKPSPPVIYPVKSPAGGPSATFYPFRPYPTVPLTPHKGYSIKHVPSKPLPAPVHHVKAAVPKPYPVKVYPAPLPVPTVTPTAAQTPAATLGPQVTPEPRPMLPVPQYRPLYAVHPAASPSSVGLKEKAFAKLKAPFQYLHPSYSYYYAPQQW